MSLSQYSRVTTAMRDKWEKLFFRKMIAIVRAIPILAVTTAGWREILK